MRPGLATPLPVAALLLVLAALAGCAANPQRSPSPADPWEPMNRGLFAVNDSLDRTLLRPTAKAYAKATPQWLQTGIGNFYVNLAYPATIANQALQGKFKLAASDTGRFLVNTIFGLAGFIDLASWDGIPLHDEDFGQTLGVWGVPPGPFLMVPLIGPSTLRDTPSRIADDFATPFRWYNSDNERWFSLALFTVQKRAQLLPTDATLERVFDRYAFIRDAHLQRREYRVRDGNVPETTLEDPEPGLEDETDAGENP